MNRREILGVCAGVTLAGLSGCVDAVADATTRTGSGPAVTYVPAGGGTVGSDKYLAPAPESTSITKAPLTIEGSVAGVSGSVDIDGWLTTSQYQSSEFHAARTMDPETVDDIHAGSNKDFDDDGYEPEGAVAYLEGEAVIGERFLLSLPDANPPGSSTPMATFSPAQLLDAVTHNDYDPNDDPVATVEFKPDADLTAETKLTGVRAVDGDHGPVRLQDRQGDTETMDKVGKAVLYGGSSDESDDGAQGLPEEWPGEVSVKGGTISNSILAGAIVTVEGDGGSTVDLPALLHLKRIQHGDDYLFDGGWMLDAGRIYGDAATVLVGGGPNPLLGLSSDDLDAAGDAIGSDRLPSERSRLGGRVYTGAATADLLPYLPDGLREGVGQGWFASISKRSARKGRNPQTGKEIKIPAKKITTLTNMVGTVRVAEGRWACDGDTAGVCRTVRAHADGRYSLLERAETYRDAGLEMTVPGVLQEVRAIVNADIDLLRGAEDRQAVGDLLGLERALRRKIDLALDPIAGDETTTDDDSERDTVDISMASWTDAIPGDDDGDGLWDGIDASAVAGDVSTEELRIDGQRVGIGHTIALREGRKGMNAVDVRRTDGVTDGEDDGSGPPPVRYWDSIEADAGSDTTTLTVVTNVEGRAMNKAELIDSIASEADIQRSHALRGLDAFIDTTSKLHAGIEKDQVKRGMVVAAPDSSQENESGEEYFVHATGLIDEIRDEDEVRFEALKPTIVPLDAPVVHLTTSTKALKKGNRVALVEFGSDSTD